MDSNLVLTVTFKLLIILFLRDNNLFLVSVSPLFPNCFALFAECNSLNLALNTDFELIFVLFLKAEISSNDKEGPFILLFTSKTWIVLFGHPLQNGAPTDKFPPIPIIYQK